MTYPVYAQKARLPQRRPRFLFYCPRAEHYTRCLYPSPPHCCSWVGVFTQPRHRDTKETPRHRGAKTLRHRNSKTSRPHTATPSTSSNRPTLHTPATTDRQHPLRLQPAGSFHSDHNRQPTKQERPTSLPRAGTPRPLPRHKKKREAARIGAASRSFSCRRAPTSATYPTLRRDDCCDVCGKP